jgi:hypothetical protein
MSFGQDAQYVIQLCDESLLQDDQQSARAFAVLSTVTTELQAFELH